MARALRPHRLQRRARLRPDQVRKRVNVSVCQPPPTNSRVHPFPLVAAPACSMRALFGKDKSTNAVHGSDSKEAAARELALVFDKLFKA